MAGNAISNTFMTYDAKGLREDLSDTIWNISPTTTPFVTSIGKEKATATYTEWQTDALDAADGTNAQVQGDDVVTFHAITPTKRLGNRTQIVRKDFLISGTEEVAMKAGRKSEVAYQLSLKGKAIKNDIETICLRNQAAVAAAAGTAPTLASVLSWIKTNTNKAGTDPTGDGSDARGDGTQRALTEAMLKDVLSKIFVSSGEQPDTMLVPPGLKSQVSAMPGNATRFIEASSEKIVAGVNLYAGDFSEVKIVPDRFMRSRDLLVLNTDYWALSWFRPIQMKELAPTGDAMKRMIIGEFTLIARNEAASGGVFDLS